MEAIKTSTIRAIAPGGVWNGMDKHLVTMADGVQYTFFFKSGTPFPKQLNEQVRFEITNEQYNNAKFVGARPANNNYPPKTNYNSQPVAGSSFTKDELIVRQTVIKSSAEFNARNGNIDLLLDHAEMMYNWIKYGK